MSSTEKTLRRRRASSKRDRNEPHPVRPRTPARLESERDELLEQLADGHRRQVAEETAAQSPTWLHFDWLSGLPIDEAVTTENRRALLTAIGAWVRWATAIVETADAATLRRVDRTITEFAAAVHRVRLRSHGTLDAVDQQLAGADLRNTIIGYALSCARSVTPIDMAASVVIGLASKRAPRLAERLRASQPLVEQAVALTMRDGYRAEGIYILERVMLGRRCRVNRVKRYGSAIDRQSAERRYEQWLATRSRT